MHDHPMTPAELDRYVRTCVTVFVALIVLTGLTVGVSTIHLSDTGHIVMALAIASFKASLVGLFFMHLKGERKSIHWLLILSFLFFAVLVGVVLGMHLDTTTGLFHLHLPSGAQVR